MMGCEPVKLPGGGVAIACGRGRGSKRPCRWCDRQAPYLCDFPVRRAGKATTCDAPICDTHRSPKGPETDHCPDHAGKRPEA